MVNPSDIVLRCLLCLLLWATAAACSSDDDAPAGGSTDDGSPISMTFTIVTDPAPASRALGVWEEEAANAAERILNLRDMRILLFDQSGSLLKAVSPSDVDYIGSEITNDGYYTVSVAFNHDYFDKFNDDDNVTFQVMILANLRGAGGDYATYSPGMKAADIKDSFRLAADYYPTADSGIPMYGFKSFTLKKTLLMQGLDAEPVGDIDMIRSLCKIEVTTDKIVNALDYPPYGKYPRVLNVEMVSWLDRGYIRPRFDDFAAGLRDANVYSPAVPVTTPVPGKIVTSGLYRFYCPEAAKDDVRFRVTAILAPDESPRTYEIGLGGFDYGEPSHNNLVRNHIYRYNVRALNTIADLTVVVDDWVTRTDEFELNDIVSMQDDGFLKWTYNDAEFAVSNETYNGKPEQQLSILNGTSSYATGTFHIISPRGATWRAYFIPGENGVDAFEFVDIDGDGNVIPGSAKVFEEGVVGERATVHIRGRGSADSYRHWAELVIEVLTADGNVLYAPITAAMSSRFIIYRENRL